MKVPIAVSAAEDPLQVRCMLRASVQSMPALLTEPRPDAAFVDHTGAALEFVVFGWVADIEQRAAVTEQLRFRLWEHLQENDIALPA